MSARCFVQGGRVAVICCVQDGRAGVRLLFRVAELREMFFHGGRVGM